MGGVFFFSFRWYRVGVHVLLLHLDTGNGDLPCVGIIRALGVGVKAI